MRFPILPKPPLPEKLFVSVFFLLFPVFLLGQQYNIVYEDILYLKNGWILHGELQGSGMDSLVTFQTHDRNTFVFPREDVKEISMVPVKRKELRNGSTPPREVVYREKGYYLAFQFGVINGINNNAWGNSNTAVTANPQFINGYRFHRLLATGIGVAYNNYERGHIMPLFLDIRGDLLQRKVTPHYYGNVGYSIPLYQREDLFDWWGEPLMNDFKLYGGMLTEGGFGVKVNTASGMGWLFSGGYRIQQVKESYSWGDSKIEEKYTYQRISLQFGIIF